MDHVLHIATVVWMFGAFALFMSLNVVAYRKAKLAAMMEQVDRDGVIRESRLTVYIGRDLRSLSYLSMSLPDETLVPRYFRYPSIRSEVQGIRRLTRTLHWLGVIWAMFLMLIIAVQVAQRCF